jgi:hypothetical protein
MSTFDFYCAETVRIMIVVYPNSHRLRRVGEGGYFCCGYNTFTHFSARPWKQPEIGGASY